MVSGKTVLITGASAGLGKEMAYAFAKQGATVGLAARRKDRLAALREDIEHRGGRAIALQADAADPQSMKQALEAFIEQTGKLDVLINNAGTGVFGRKPSEEEYYRIYEVNVHSVYRLSQWALPHLEKTGGNIINVGSTVTDRPFAGELVYSASKGAVTTMTKAMAATWGKRGVRVNMLQPGIISSEFNVTAGIPPEIDQAAYEGSVHLNALPRTGLPEDAAQAALFLASDHAKFITGAVLKVDGGITLAVIRS